MTVRERLEQLKTSEACTPNAAWKVLAREKLLAQIKNTANNKASVSSRLSFVHTIRAYVDTFVPDMARAYVRPVATVFASLVVMVTTSLLSVSASQGSVPGEVLWHVKLAAEKTQVNMARVIGDTEGVARINLDRAAERAAEIKQIINTESSLDATKIITELAIPELEETLKGNQKTLESIKTTDPDKAVAIASLTTEKMKEVHGSLSDTLVQAASDSTVLASSTAFLAEKVSEATTLAQQVSLNAVEAVVEKGSEAEAKLAVQTHIDTVVKDAQTTQALAEEVKKSANTQGVAAISTTTMSISPSATSTTITVSTTVNALVSQSAESTLVIQSSTVISAPTTTVVEALEKAKSATEATIEAKTALVDLTKTIVTAEHAALSNTSTATAAVPQSAAVSSTPVVTTTSTK